jgi:hypothetical protein
LLGVGGKRERDHAESDRDNELFTRHDDSPSPG